MADYRVYIGVIGIMEKKMETIIMGYTYIGVIYQGDRSLGAEVVMRQKLQAARPNALCFTEVLGLAVQASGHSNQSREAKHPHGQSVSAALRTKDKSPK